MLPSQPRTKLVLLTIAILLSVLLSACLWEEPRGCTHPPKGFSESDLIGTWEGDVESPRDSTIIIRADGQYKQVMHIKRTGFDYESDWKPWRVTYSADGLPYLHLQGMLMCAYWSTMDCSTGQTGLTPLHIGDTKDPFTGEYYWYDGCQEDWVNTPGEAVFMVLGVQARFDQPPRGIDLTPFTKSADGTTGPYYELRVP